MGICESVKRFFRAGLFVASMASICVAEEKKLEEKLEPFPTETRSRVAAPYILSNNSVANPMTSFEANSSYWLMFNEGVGKASDLLGQELNLDDHWSFRVGFFLLQGYLGECSNYLSHEVAHGFYSAKKSGNGMSEWREFELGIPDDGITFFRNTKNMDVKFLVHTLDIDGFLKSITSGINQQEENTRLLHEECVHEDRIFFDEGWLFVANKLHPLRYILKEKDYKKADIRAWYSGAERIPDPVGYAEGLKFKGIKVSKKDLLTQSGIAVFGSLPLYYNLYAVGNYLATGERSVGQAEISTPIGGITLPLINYYLTKNGGFYNVSAFVRAKNGMLFEGEFGIDADFIGEGRVNTFRFGAKAYDIAFLDWKYFPRISPYAYVNFKKEELVYDGVLAGSEITLPFYYDDEGRRGSLVTKIEYSDNDIIENDIKLESLGWNVSVGLRFKF